MGHFPLRLLLGAWFLFPWAATASVVMCPRTLPLETFSQLDNFSLADWQAVQKALESRELPLISDWVTIAHGIDEVLRHIETVRHFTRYRHPERLAHAEALRRAQGRFFYVSAEWQSYERHLVRLHRASVILGRNFDLLARLAEPSGLTAFARSGTGPLHGAAATFLRQLDEWVAVVPPASDVSAAYYRFGREHPDFVIEAGARLVAPLDVPESLASLADHLQTSVNTSEGWIAPGLEFDRQTALAILLLQAPQLWRD